MRDIRQSKNYSQYLSGLGWKIGRLDGTYYFEHKLPFAGKIIKLQRPKSFPFKRLERLIEREKPSLVIVEPKTQNLAKILIDKGFDLNKKTFLPSKTLILDISKSPDKIFSTFKKDARSAIRKNIDKKMIYEVDMKRFLKIWKNAVGWKKYVPPLKNLQSLKKSFRENCSFLRDNTDTGAIFLIAGKTLYYWQAFTGRKGRRNLTQYKTVWEGILWGKKRGAVLCDLEGIYDNRFPIKSWQGFTHFKKSFGGKELSFPGTFIKRLSLFSKVFFN